MEFGNTILLVCFSYSEHLTFNKKFLYDLYHPYFKKIFFYADLPLRTDQDVNYVDISKGAFSPKIFDHFFENYQNELENIDGIFYVMDDALINLNQLNNYDPKKIIYSKMNGSVPAAESMAVIDAWVRNYIKLPYFYSLQFCINNLLNDPEFKRIGNNLEIQYNGGPRGAHIEDFLYLPKKYFEKFFPLIKCFVRHNVYVQITLPSVIYHIKQEDDYTAFLRQETALHIHEGFNGIQHKLNSGVVCVHPVKLSDPNLKVLIKNYFEENK